MGYYYLFSALILLTTLFTYINFKFIKWPPTIAVMVFSLLCSAVLLLFKQFFPTLTAIVAQSISAINFYDLVMRILLGFLLFAGAYHTNVFEFKKELKPVLSLAIISTTVSTFCVGTLLYLVFQLLHIDITYINCLLFGALISPTDPIAALGILRKIGAPEKLEQKITGESLFNDGIAIVLFTTLLDMGQEGITENVFFSAVKLFLKEAGGGLLYGGLLGLIGFFTLKSTDSYKVAILITLTMVMTGYTVALLLHVSAPISIVVAGLICSRSKNIMFTREDRNYVSTFWNLIDGFINVVLFLLIGFEMLVISVNWIIFVIGVICIIILLLSRFLSLLIPYYIHRNYFERNTLVLLTWGGLRGAVSIALALSLPEAFHRNEFLPITYLIAIFSIVVQGLTIGKLVKNAYGLR